jgi:hypothetical protein
MNKVPSTASDPGKMNKILEILALTPRTLSNDISKTNIFIKITLTLKNQVLSGADIIDLVYIFY